VPASAVGLENHAAAFEAKVEAVPVPTPLERKLAYEVGEPARDQQPPSLHLERRASRVLRVDLVEQFAHDGDSRAMASQTEQVRAQSGERCQPTATGVLARDLERLGIEYTRQCDERGLDSCYSNAVEPPNHLRAAIVAPVHDDPVRANSTRRQDDDLGHLGSNSFEAVHLGGGATGCRRTRPRPEQSGDDRLLV
jgi:hypothetical protein